MSLANQVGALERHVVELEAKVAILTGQLGLLGVQTPEVDLMIRHKLNRSEASLLQRLMMANGKIVDRCTLEAALPARDHAADRNLKIVDVQVCHLRKKVGRDVIENVWGQGWRLDPSRYAAI